MSSTMSNVASSVKRTFEEMASNPKQADLLRVTVDPQEAKSGQLMTTNHGVRVANTDTW